MGHSFINNGHLREIITLTSVPKNLAVELSLHVPVFATYVSHGWVLNTQLSAQEANALNNWATLAIVHIAILLQNSLLLKLS